MERILPEGRHEMYPTPRSAFHSSELHSSTNNGNGYNVNGSINVNVNTNGARYNQHISTISRTANSQEHLHLNHLQKLHSTHNHHQALQQHFEANDNSPMHKISQSNGSDSDINAIDDDANVLNLSRRRNSDTTICNNNNSNSNNNKTKNGSTTPPRITYVSFNEFINTKFSLLFSQFFHYNNPIFDFSFTASINKYSTE